MINSALRRATGHAGEKQRAYGCTVPRAYVNLNPGLLLVADWEFLVKLLLHGNSPTNTRKNGFNSKLSTTSNAFADNVSRVTRYHNNRDTLY